MLPTISIGLIGGRISPKGTNVIVPPENAGIGDLIYGTRSDFFVIGRGTANAKRISNRDIFGCIYGFVNGEAMVVAPTRISSTLWGNYVQGMPTFNSGVLMRNGVISEQYAQMNTKQNSGYIQGGSGYPDVLTSAYRACGLKSGFTGKAAQGTWDEYISQTLRVQGAPGSPFGAVTTNVKVHEFGRWMGKTFGGSQPTTSALGKCYNYGNGGGEWWLPSMFELGELMIDEHNSEVNKNDYPAFDKVNNLDNYWSCVAESSGAIWIYQYGASRTYIIGATASVRPVTLFKLT